MKSIIFLIPYIGKLPESFPVYLKSCGMNPTVDFLLYTDDEFPYEYPANVRVKYVTFEELKKRFQKNFDVAVSLENPYKFCDFKPMYGEIFAQDIEGYDYWGFCDLDIVWGNIRKYVTDAVLESADRVYTRGHCSIFKNNVKTNSLYKTLPHNNHLNWRTVIQSPLPYCYDEWAGHLGGGYFLHYEGKRYPDV